MSNETGIRLEQVRIVNFRCLRSIEVQMPAVAVLIGENNAGKSSFVEALHAAIGIGTRSLSGHDVFVDAKESGPPRDRAVYIDLLFRPSDHESKASNEFPQGSAWLELFGSSVFQDDDDHDFVGIRTQMRWDPIRADYFTERRFLKSWAKSLDQIERSQTADRTTQVAANQLDAIGLYLLDANRDAAADLRTRGSIWQRLVAEPGIAEEDIESIEEKLNEINRLVVEKSEVLSHVQLNLSEVAKVIHCDAEKVEVTPVARKFRDLNRGMDVVMSTAGASQFPISRQGLGTRSLATLFLFRAFMAWRLGAKTSDAVHPLVAIEEPESHLHPQAQRAAKQQIDSIPGQKIITTHSPYVCAQSTLQSFVHFSKSDSCTQVSQLNPKTDPDLTEEDVRRINREVMNTRGELLFARHIILFEGETEEQAIPAFASDFWGRHPHELGVTFVGVGGDGNYLPFIRVCKCFNIQWAIFSDGETEALKAVESALKKASEPEISKNPRVFFLPDHQNFEQYVASALPLTALRRMIVEFVADSRSLNAQAIAAIEQKWAKKDLNDVVEELRNYKTSYAPRIPATFAKEFGDSEDRCPKLVRELLSFCWPSNQILESAETDHER